MRIMQMALFCSFIAFGLFYIFGDKDTAFHIWGIYFLMQIAMNTIPQSITTKRPDGSGEEV